MKDRTILRQAQSLLPTLPRPRLALSQQCRNQDMGRLQSPVVLQILVSAILLATQARQRPLPSSQIHSTTAHRRGLQLNTWKCTAPLLKFKARWPLPCPALLRVKALSLSAILKRTQLQGRICLGVHCYRKASTSRLHPPMLARLCQLHRWVALGFHQ